MPITLACPHCSKSLSAPDNSAGSVVACPHCRQPLSVPATEATAPDEGDNPFAVEEPARQKPRYKRRADASGNGNLWLIGAGVALVVAIVLAWYFTRTDPEVARVEAEYSELCDDIDYLAKDFNKGNREKRIQAMDPELISTAATLKPLLDRREHLVYQFHKKYGRNPRYLKPDERDYRSTPIR